MKIKSSDIEQEITVCPYCMDDWTEKKDTFGCCGEVHSEKAYLTTDDECFLESEVEIETEGANRHG